MVFLLRLVFTNFSHCQGVFQQNSGTKNVKKKISTIITKNRENLPKKQEKKTAKKITKK